MTVSLWKGRIRKRVDDSGPALNPLQTFPYNECQCHSRCCMS